MIAMAVIKSKYKTLARTNKVVWLPFYRRYRIKAYIKPITYSKKTGMEIWTRCRNRRQAILCSTAVLTIAATVCKLNTTQLVLCCFLVISIVPFLYFEFKRRTLYCWLLNPVLPNTGVNGIFHWHHPSGRTMVLGWSQPLTEMNTRNISWGVKAADAYGWQPYHLHVPIVLKSGSLFLLEPSGSVQACNGTALLYYEIQLKQLSSEFLLVVVRYYSLPVSLLHPLLLDIWQTAGR